MWCYSSRVRRFAAAAFAALALPAFAAASRDLPEIESSGELRVLVVDGAPALVSLKPGTEPGLERELLDAFARLHAVHVRLVEVGSWEELIPALLAGKGDLVAGGVTDTPERRRQIDFCAEVFPSRNVVMTRKPSPLVTTLGQLRTVKIGTIRGTNLAVQLADAQVPQANIDYGIPVNDWGQVLRSGRVTALLDGIEDALLIQIADPDVQLGMFLGPPQSLAFGMRKDAPALRGALDEYVNSVRKTPTWSRLVVKYFGQSAADVLKKARGE